MFLFLFFSLQMKPIDESFTIRLETCIKKALGDLNRNMEILMSVKIPMDAKWKWKAVALL